MTVIERIDEARRRWNVLDHPFYLRWERGELSREELAFYAGEYRHAVVALADGLEGGGPELAEHAAEERDHVELWDRFAGELGADTTRAPRRETERCVWAWSGGSDLLERLAIAHAVESGQPAISRTKLEGLTEHYGFEEGPATEYFSLHAELDVEHAAESRALIEERAGEEDCERMLAAAEAALRGNWELLDGVEAR